MKLFGKKPTQTVTVTLEADTARPGDPVVGSVQISGEPDDKVRGAVATLVCSHQWAFESTDDETDRTTVTWHTDVDTAGECALVPEGGAVTAGNYPVRFTMPADAVPSSEGAVEWSVAAVIKRRMGKDVTGSAAVHIPTPEARNASVALEPPRGRNADALALEVPVRSVVPGAIVEGAVLVQPTGNVRFEKLLVDLQMQREDKRHTTDRKPSRRTIAHYSTVTLAQGVTAAGDVQRFPFSLQVPEDAAATTYSAHTVRTWWVVVSGKTVKAKFNQVLQLELNVYNDAIAHLPPAR